MDREQLCREIEAYQPFNEQEQIDREMILHFIRTNVNAFSRSNTMAHITASSWVVNRERNKVLLVYHKIYDSWSWTGGHADGETDLLAVAMREVTEETGVSHLKPIFDRIYSLEALTVDGHEKKGQYVSSHLHLNVTYLLEADDREELKICEAENTGVAWFSLQEALKVSTEPWFVKRIYAKLNDKLMRDEKA